MAQAAASANAAVQTSANKALKIAIPEDIGP